MRSWEEMKDFSYVGIKLTKAKTISEGLTKCKIQKLTRQNPLYEHIKFHQLIEGRKHCHLCHALPRNHTHSPPRQRGNTAPLPDSPRRQRTTRVHSQRGLVEDSQQEQASREFDRFQGVIERFDSGLRRTRSQFGRMRDHSRITTRYFLTEADELALQIDEHRLPPDTVGQAKSSRMQLMEEAQAKQQRQREVERKVRELNKQVKFPLEKHQMSAIVQLQRERNTGANSKLGRMMSSLYEYKAKATYAHKMKVIKQYNK